MPIRAAANIGPTLADCAGAIGRVSCLLLLLIPAACGGGTEQTAAAVPDNPFACPRVRILGDLDELAHYRPGAAATPENLVSRADMADFFGDCEYGDWWVDVSLDLVINAQQGPASDGSRDLAEYFVAVLDPEGTILNKQRFNAALDFAGGVAQSREQLAITIPLSRLADGVRYNVVAGFQLSPEAFEAIQAEKAQAVSPLR